MSFRTELRKSLHPNLGPAPTLLEQTISDWHDWAIWKGIDERCGTGFASRFQADLLDKYAAESQLATQRDLWGGRTSKQGVRI